MVSSKGRIQSAEANVVLTTRTLGGSSQAGGRAIIDFDLVVRMSSPLACLNGFLAHYKSRRRS